MSAASSQLTTPSGSQVSRVPPRWRWVDLAFRLAEWEVLIHLCTVVVGVVVSASMGGADVNEGVLGAIVPLTYFVRVAMELIGFGLLVSAARSLPGGLAGRVAACAWIGLVCIALRTTFDVVALVATEFAVEHLLFVFELTPLVPLVAMGALMLVARGVIKRLAPSSSTRTAELQLALIGVAIAYHLSATYTDALAAIPGGVLAIVVLLSRLVGLILYLRALRQARRALAATRDTTAMAEVFS